MALYKFCIVLYKVISKKVVYSCLVHFVHLTTQTTLQ